ncbi:MAG: hypothetical protein AAF206_30830 [Bacteroidota bacterium]
MQLKNLFILICITFLCLSSQSVLGQERSTSDTQTLQQSQQVIGEFSEYRFSIYGIYPNPVIDHLVIRGEVSEACAESRCLYAIIVDSDGNQYYEEKLDLSTGQHEIPLVDWPSQYYFLMIFTSEGRLRYDAVFLKRN